MVHLEFDAKKQLRIQLMAQSPLIHFQASDKELRGVTLRASEVRPQLDRYIFRNIAGIEPGTEITESDILSRKKELIKHREYQGIFVNENKPDFALKYKMAIETAPNEQREIITLEKENSRYSAYKPFFSNTGIKDPKKRLKGVINNPFLIITCFNDNVRSLIKKYLEDFFLVTNFGTRQGKGFGSFILTGSGKDEKQIVTALKKNYGAKKCYRMRLLHRDPGRCYADYFDYIGSFAQFMKSGQSRSYNNIEKTDYVKGYIFQYMLNKGIGNEKKWMKNNGISTKYYTKHPPKQEPEDMKVSSYEYVRAMLGTQDNILYQDWKQKPLTGYMTISISDAEDAEKDDFLFERVPSPIFYKIIGNNIYIVAGRIPKKLFNHKFFFKGDVQHKSQTISKANEKQFDTDNYLDKHSKGDNPYKSGTISTPDEKQFDIDDFLAKYVRFYNNDGLEDGPRKQFPRDMRFAPKVEEVSE